MNLSRDCLDCGHIEFCNEKTRRCKDCLLVACLSCEHNSHCPPEIFYGTMACELFKLSMATENLKKPVKEELMKYRLSKKTINTLVYILAFIFGVIITLAFQGKL